MKKRICVVLAALMTAASVLTGCGVETGYTVDKKGNITNTENIYYTQEEFDSVYEDSDAESLAEYGYVGPVTVDGVEYQLFTSTEENYEITGSGFVLTATEFIYASDDSEDASESGQSDVSSVTDDTTQNISDQLSSGFAFYNITVTFPYEISSTNGTIGEDKKTVTFSLTGKNRADNAIYAYTVKSKKKITISGTDANGCTTKDSVKVESDQKVKTVTVNGKAQTSQKVKLSKDGTYTIKVETKSSSNIFTVIRDTKKPTVSGVKNGKTYTESVKIKFSDKTSGVATATLNGKAIKSGKKVTKSGKYTLKVTDLAGNTKTVKFTIK